MTLAALCWSVVAWVAVVAGPTAAAPAMRIEVVAGTAGAASHGFAATVNLEDLPAAIRVRRAAEAAAAPVEVVVRGGVYRLRAPLRLGAAEAPPGAGLSIAAAPGESVVLSGALPVEDLAPLAGDAAARIPAPARGSVLSVRLPDAWRSRWGELRRRGLGLPAQPLQAELFYRGERLPLARWPDTGFASITATPDGRDGLRFTADRPLPAGAAEEADLWAFGYWASAWAPWHVPVASIDGQPGIISLEPPKPRYGIREGGRFYLENGLSALDSPGEWYLDRAAGKLLIWPPAALRPGDLELSLTETLLELADASDVVVDGIDFAAARGDGVVIRGGAGNRVGGCVIRNIGNLAVRVTGHRNGVDRCEIHAVGDSGIVLDGGDRPTLTPGGLYAVDNRIHDFGLWTRTYTAGVMVAGVGNQVAGNHIFAAPHMGIQIKGNDHLIEGNLLHDLVRETSDAGAIYIWGDWAQRGSVIRGNTICNIRAPRLAIGIYLDLFASGIAIEGNRLLNVQWGMLLNGGSDNTVRGNSIFGGEIPIRFDAIGLSWSRKAVLDSKSNLRGPLAQLPIKGELWQRRYPGLATALDGDPGMPKRNVFEGNIVYGDSLGRYDAKAANHTSMRDNVLRPLPPPAELAGMFPPACLAESAS